MKVRILCSAVATALLALLGLSHSATAGDKDCCVTECAPKKVCVPTTEIKKTAKRVYTDECSDFCTCVPNWSNLRGMLFNGWRKKDDSCNPCGGCDTGCAACGSCPKKPHTRKDLIVKIRRTEECVNTCAPGYACPAEPCCTAPGTEVIAPPAVPAAPKAEPIAPPLPKEEKKEEEKKEEEKKEEKKE